MEIKISKDFSYKFPEFSKNSVFLMNGENNGLISILAKEISDKFLPDEKFIFDYDEIKNSLNEIIEIINTNDFFSAKKLIKIYNITGIAVNFIKSIIDYMSKTSNEVLIILMCKDELDKKIQLYKMFEAESDFLFLINAKVDSDIVVKNNIKSFFPNISSEIENLLLEKLPRDRIFLIEELRKINLYINEGQQLSKDLINKIVDDSNNYSVFEVIDMIGSKDTKFFNATEYLFVSDSANIIQFLHLLYNHFMNLYDIKINNTSGFVYRQQILEIQAKKWKKNEVANFIDIICEAEKVAINQNENQSINFLLFNLLIFSGQPQLQVG